MTPTSLFPSVEDQQPAGVIMWVPGGLFHLFVGLGASAVWIAGSTEERMIESDERPW